MKATPKMLLAAATVAMAGLTVNAVTYYVDATNGNDSNAGTSPTAAFKTYARAIGKVSKVDFSSDPAEVIFKSGTYPAPSRADINLCRGKVVVRGESGNPADVIIQGSDNTLMYVCVTNTADELVISGLTFKDGAGKWGYPGGVQVGSDSRATQGRMVVSNCVFTGCSVRKETNNTSGMGAALRANGSDTHIIDCTFADNYITNYSGGAAYTYNGKGIHFDGCTFLRNRCLGNYECGGALCIGNDSKAYISDCNFTSNSVLQYGGAIYIVSGNSAEIDKCVFDGNSVTSSSDGHGAALTIRTNASAVVNNSTFTNNYSGRHASCIWSDGGKLALSDSIIACNTSKQIGGCVYATSSSRFFITNLTAYANTQNAGGGGVFAAEGTGGGELVGCTFTDNHSDDSSGGAVRISGGAYALTNCTFGGNTAYMGGGMCYSSDKGLQNSIVDCEFSGNKAQVGGGLCVKSSNLVVRASRFFGNSVKIRANQSQHGGGIANATTGSLSGLSSVTGLEVRDCVFGGNVACRGGGFYNGQFNTYTVENCIFTNNVANECGGGMYVRDDDSVGGRLDTPTVIRGCLFAYNSATGSQWNAEGGGVYIAGAKEAYGTCPRLLESCTVVSNTVSSVNNGALAGPGIALHPSFRGVVSNSIVAFNLRKWKMDSRLYSSGEDLSSVFHCCAWPSCGEFTLDHKCFSADPRFVDVSGGDCRLTRGSPCRKVGEVAGWMATAVDLDGNPRLGGYNRDVVDIGAWQIQPKFGTLLIFR